MSRGSRRCSTTMATGVRGDLAPWSAPSCSTSRRAADPGASASFGKLREPVMRLTGWARAFNATSPSGAWAIGDTSSTATRLGQSPGRSPERLQLLPPRLYAAQHRDRHRRPGRAGIPDRQRAVGDRLCELYGDPGGDRQRRFPGRLCATWSPRRRQPGAGRRGRHPARRAAVAPRPRRRSWPRSTRISTTATNAALNRVYTAVLLTLATPEYLVQK